MTTIATLFTGFGVGDYVEWESAYIGGQEVKGRGAIKQVWSHFARIHPPVPPRWNDYEQDYVIDLRTVTKHIPKEVAP